MKRIGGKLSLLKLSLLSDISSNGMLFIPCNDSHVWIRWKWVTPPRGLVMVPVRLTVLVSRVVISLLPLAPEIVSDDGLIYHVERLEEVALIVTSTVQEGVEEVRSGL